MKRIKQLDETGCGLACVAMLSNKSYNHVKQLALQTSCLSVKGEYYTKPKHLRFLLNCFGIETSKAHSHKHWDTLPKVAIIGINYNGICYHWVVYNNGKITDPKYLENMKCPLHELRLYNCIPINVKNQ